MNHIKKAFTLTELIIVVAVIGILMMGVTVYLGGLGERARIIETQGCATSFGGEMNNYVFNALTSKNLLSGNTQVSPDVYTITLRGGNYANSNNCSKTKYESDGIFCNELMFGYERNSEIVVYKTITIGNTCRQNQANMGLYRIGGTSGDISAIKMNKGFAPRSINERKIFYLQYKGEGEANKLTQGDIMVLLCPSSNSCSGGKEVGKFHVDARTQTITFQKCRFYNEDLITCEARED